MSVLNKIREAKDLGRTTITIEEWGVNLLLIEPPRKVILDLQDKYDVLDEQGRPKSGKDVERFGTAAMVEIVHDVDGKKVFESVEQAEEVLAEKSAKVQAKLTEAIQVFINGPTIEEAEGNSGGTQSGPSSTD